MLIGVGPGLCFLAGGLLLIDDKLSDVQPSHFELLYLEAFDPAALYHEPPYRQGADRHGTEGAHGQRCGQPREGHLSLERRLFWRPLLWRPCSAHLMHRPSPLSAAKA